MQNCECLDQWTNWHCLVNHHRRESPCSTFNYVQEIYPECHQYFRGKPKALWVLPQQWWWCPLPCTVLITCHQYLMISPTLLHRLSPGCQSQKYVHVLWDHHQLVEVIQGCVLVTMIFLLVNRLLHNTAKLNISFGVAWGRTRTLSAVGRFQKC